MIEKKNGNYYLLEVYILEQIKQQNLVQVLKEFLIVPTTKIIEETRWICGARSHRAAPALTNLRSRMEELTKWRPRPLLFV